MDAPTIYTIGHSTRPIDVFLELLRAQQIAALVDIRTIPKSRRHPQFDGARLHETLTAAGITYLHEPRLGGLRKPKPDSVNLGWRNESFRGYADHMGSAAFKRGLDALIDTARRSTTVIMCAEAVPWRCHRSLVADALLAAGCPVLHIIGPGAPSPHRFTPFLREENGELHYPRPASHPLLDAAG